MTMQGHDKDLYRKYFTVVTARWHIKMNHVPGIYLISSIPSNKTQLNPTAMFDKEVTWHASS
jgi:hypothetical protein